VIDMGRILCPCDFTDFSRRALGQAVELRGKPPREIVELARSTDAHLVVMGVHGHGVIDRLLFGSTTHHVVREAPCPVLSVRQPPEESATG
jgi:nucleotide-binding universal stress UspA family protein